MGLSIGIKSRDETTNAKGTNSSLLCEFLLGLGDILGHIFDWWAVIVVEPVALALDSGLVGKDPTIGSQAGICHVHMIVKLDYLFNCPSLLQLGDCFFLDEMIDTSAARMTDELVTKPTAQRPFLTA